MFRFIIKDSWVMPSCVSFLFVGDFEQVFAQCVKSAAKHYFAVLVCSSFSWGQHYSVLALNIVGSRTLVFIPIASGQFEQALPNLSSFDQSTISSSLKKFFKPKKSERHSSFVWKLISKPCCVLVMFICTKQNKKYKYTHIDVIIYPDISSKYFVKLVRWKNNKNPNVNAFTRLRIFIKMKNLAIREFAFFSFSWLHLTNFSSDWQKKGWTKRYIYEMKKLISLV